MADSKPRKNRRASYNGSTAFTVALHMSKQMKHVRPSAGALVGHAHELLAFSDSDDSAEEGNTEAFTKQKSRLRGAAWVYADAHDGWLPSETGVGDVLKSLRDAASGKRDDDDGEPLVWGAKWAWWTRALVERVTLNAFGQKFQLEKLPVVPPDPNHDAELAEKTFGKRPKVGKGNYAFGSTQHHEDLGELTRSERLQQRRDDERDARERYERQVSAAVQARDRIIQKRRRLRAQFKRNGRRWLPTRRATLFGDVLQHYLPPPSVSVDTQIGGASHSSSKELSFVGPHVTGAESAAAAAAAAAMAAGMVSASASSPTQTAGRRSSTSRRSKSPKRRSTRAGGRRDSHGLLDLAQPLVLSPDMQRAAAAVKERKDILELDTASSRAPVLQGGDEEVPLANQHAALLRSSSVSTVAAASDDASVISRRTSVDTESSTVVEEASTNATAADVLSSAPKTLLDASGKGKSRRKSRRKSTTGTRSRRVSKSASPQRGRRASAVPALPTIGDESELQESKTCDAVDALGAASRVERKPIELKGSIHKRAGSTRRFSFDTDNFMQTKVSMLSQLKQDFNADQAHEDNEFYTDKAILQRASLMFDPAVRSALSLIFRRVDVDRSGTVEEREYRAMHRKMYIAIHGTARGWGPSSSRGENDEGVVDNDDDDPDSDGSDLGATSMWRTDWDGDRAGFGFLNEKRFYKCWFDVTDRFTDSLDADQYSAFLFDMAECFRLQEDGQWQEEYALEKVWVGGRRVTKSPVDMQRGRGHQRDGWRRRTVKVTSEEELRRMLERGEISREQYEQLRHQLRKYGSVDVPIKERNNLESNLGKATRRVTSEEELRALLEAGEITQEQFEQLRQQLREHGSVDVPVSDDISGASRLITSEEELRAMLERGEITQEQFESLRAALREHGSVRVAAGRGSRTITSEAELRALLESGEITQEQFEELRRQLREHGSVVLPRTTRTITSEDELRAMLERGEITQEEFERLRQELLEKGSVNIEARDSLSEWDRANSRRSSARRYLRKTITSEDELRKLLERGDITQEEFEQLLKQLREEGSVDVMVRERRRHKVRVTSEEQLREMLESGKITQEEFFRLRKQLLEHGSVDVEISSSGSDSETGSESDGHGGRRRKRKKKRGSRGRRRRASKVTWTTVTSEEELRKLLEAGEITQEQFEQLRKELREKGSVDVPLIRTRQNKRRRRRTVKVTSEDELRAMLERGDITQEEFEKLRKVLLEKGSVDVNIEVSTSGSDSEDTAEVEDKIYAKKLADSKHTKLGTDSAGDKVLALATQLRDRRLRRKGGGALGRALRKLTGKDIALDEVGAEATHLLQRLSARRSSSPVSSRDGSPEGGLRDPNATPSGGTSKGKATKRVTSEEELRALLEAGEITQEQFEQLRQQLREHGSVDVPVSDDISGASRLITSEEELRAMLERGEITQEQFESLRAALREHGSVRVAAGRGSRTITSEAELRALLESGEITQEQFEELRRQLREHGSVILPTAYKQGQQYAAVHLPILSDESVAQQSRRKRAGFLAGHMEWFALPSTVGMQTHTQRRALWKHAQKLNRARSAPSVSNVGHGRRTTGSSVTEQRPRPWQQARGYRMASAVAASGPWQSRCSSRLPEYAYD